MARAYWKVKQNGEWNWIPMDVDSIHPADRVPIRKLCECAECRRIAAHFSGGREA